MHDLAHVSWVGYINKLQYTDAAHRLITVDYQVGSIV